MTTVKKSMSIAEFRAEYELKNGKPKIPDWVTKHIEKKVAEHNETLPQKPKKPKTIKLFDWSIGVDGSFRRDGLAIAIVHLPTKETITHTFKDLRHFQKWFDGVGGYENNLPDRAVVFFEDTGRQEIVIDSLFENFCIRAKMPNNKRTRDKYAISVGKNIAATNQVKNLFIEKYKKANVEGVTPREKGAKLNIEQTKIVHKIVLPDDATQDELDAVAVAVVGYEMMLKGSFL